MDLKKVICDVLDWIHLAYNGFQVRVSANTVMGLPAP
jgi:hypothetical protein